MDSWLWWVLTCAFSLYFVILLLEFNKPSKKLNEQIDAQEKRRIDMEQRLGKMREDAAALRGKLEALEGEWDELEDRRKDLLPQANVRRMAASTCSTVAGYGGHWSKAITMLLPSDF